MCIKLYPEVLCISTVGCMVCPSICNPTFHMPAMQGTYPSSIALSVTLFAFVWVSVGRPGSDS